MTTLNPTLQAASQGLDTAAKIGNQKLAFVMTGLTCLLVAEMLYERFARPAGAFAQIDRRAMVTADRSR